MKNRVSLVIISMVIAAGFIGCDQEVPKDMIPSTLDVYQVFVDAGLPVGNYIDYTEETDPNKLMNKEGQYIAKLNFAIDTVNQLDEDDPKGGSIEIFKTPKDAKSRKEAIDAIGQKSPAFVESSQIVHEIILIRLDRNITATEAQKYFDAVKAG